MGLPVPRVATGSDLTALLLTRYLRPAERITIIGLSPRSTEPTRHVCWSSASDDSHASTTDVMPGDDGLSVTFDESAFRGAGGFGSFAGGAPRSGSCRRVVGGSTRGLVGGVSGCVTPMTGPQ